MTPVDEMIRDALSEEDANWSSELEAQSVPDMVLASFRGRFRVYVIAVYIFLFLFAAMMVFSLVQFFAAEGVDARITWGGSFLFCFASVGLLKIWYWMELNRIAVTSEIKRFQLQLARLAQEAGEEDL